MIASRYYLATVCVCAFLFPSTTDNTPRFRVALVLIYVVKILHHFFRPLFATKCYRLLLVFLPCFTIAKFFEKPTRELKNEGGYVLAPVIDSVNHDSKLETSLGFDGLRQEFTLAVDKAFKSGEQVCGAIGI